MIAIARNLGLSRETELKQSATSMPPGMVPKRKSDSGGPKKTSKTDKLLDCAAMLNSFITPQNSKTSILGFSRSSKLRQCAVACRRT